MVRISPEPLPSDVSEKLHDQLADIFLAHDEKRYCKNLLRELFTESERVMFAKRVAVMFLLDQKYSFYAISRSLQVSESTVARIDAKRQRGGYAGIIKVMKNRKHRRSMIGALETLFTLGFPGVASRKMHAQLRKDIESWKAGS